MTDVSQKIQTKTFAVSDSRLLRALLIGATLALGVLYIWQVNVSMAHGYVMSQIQKDIDSKKIENEKLLLEVARLQSIDSVTTRMQMLGLVKLDNIEYVNADSSVALR